MNFVVPDVNLESVGIIFVIPTRREISFFARDGTRLAQDVAKYDRHGIIRPPKVQLANLFPGKDHRRAKFGISLQVAIAANWFLDAEPKIKSRFIEPMSCAATPSLPRNNVLLHSPHTRCRLLETFA